ncbi:hypothetical protein GWR56_02540 [Mucilaginibacter sp. 14171R-50]|uniref:hypothetical protein n=1 Tax=Mucilaginibacter sp. 14171R-50 TaxID=2703789 RepID=UPI00138C5935|nr:hypothetical protein [Mucilaginibacter sp. 14171R-50]QHS54473.1 hypothetical protein GWR56_02540 [Mucilaginibacter sp. 14171R-50]
MKKLLLSAVFALTLCFAAKAQDEAVTENPGEVKETKALTIDELKAQRAELVAMLKSEEFQKVLAKADALKAPKDAGIAGVDALAGMVTTMLTQLKENRQLIPQMYASVTGQTIDGLPTTEVKPLSPDQLMNFSKLCLSMGSSLLKSSKDLITLPGEIKSAGLMKGIKGLKSLMYIKSSIGALKQEISFNSKMINNLIATNKLAMAANTTK